MEFGKDEYVTSKQTNNSDRIKLGNCRICQDKSSGIIINSMILKLNLISN